MSAIRGKYPLVFTVGEIPTTSLEAFISSTSSATSSSVTTTLFTGYGSVTFLPTTSTTVIFFLLRPFFVLSMFF
ncbi:MAG: hypothetical protein LRS41_00040 [Caldisphaeraceae archaeon]|nr:hypothetical protein [Caldisphaeraceae archaeon]